VRYTSKAREGESIDRRQRGHHAASRRWSPDAISLLKSKSVGAEPVISRAPRLKVTSSMADSMNTVRRLRNCTMYIRWTSAQISQAGGPADHRQLALVEVLERRQRLRPLDFPDDRLGGVRTLLHGHLGPARPGVP